MRPHRLKLLAAIFSATLAALALAAPAVPPGSVERAEAASLTPERPNIVVVTTDDQTVASFNAEVMPAATKLLVDGGTWFGNVIATTPLCCPSRATMITGQYAHNHGAVVNGYQLLRDPDSTLPTWLAQAGYRTVHVGKYLNGYEGAVSTPTEVAPGWNQWYTTLFGTRYYAWEMSVNGSLRQFGTDNEDYLTRFLNQKAARMIRRWVPGRRPLYLQVDQRAPHIQNAKTRPGRCGNGSAVPDPRDRTLFREEPFPPSPSFNEFDVTDKPSFIRNRPPLNEFQIERVAREWRCALGALRAVDRGIRTMKKELDRAGELNQTVLIFTSDNGYYYGEHRLRKGKVVPYEEALRVPLAMRVPNRYRDGAPRVSEVQAPVANIDLVPTILKLAGARPCISDTECRTMDGRSLLPLLRGATEGWPSDRALVVEYGPGGNPPTCEYAGVRVPGAIYIEHEQVESPETGGCVPSTEGELYDLSIDPFELENEFSANPLTSSGRQEELAERLDQRRDCAGIAGRDRRVGDRPHCE